MWPRHPLPRLPPPSSRPPPRRPNPPVPPQCSGRSGATGPVLAEIGLGAPAPPPLALSLLPPPTSDACDPTSSAFKDPPKQPATAWLELYDLVAGCSFRAFVAGAGVT